jgi:hypothetical protein
MRVKSALIASFLIWKIFDPASHAAAQSTTTGEIYGGVVDRDTAQRLPEASMTLENLRNGRPLFGRTNSRGNYVFSLVPPGSYKLRAERRDYLGAEYSNIEVPLNQPKLVIPVLALSRAGATAPGQTRVPRGIGIAGVFGFAPPRQIPAASAPAGQGLTSLVALRDWALRSNFDSSLVPALPLRGGRTFDQLALFAPGVARAPFSAGEGPAVGIGVGSIGQFSVNGLRSRSNNFTVDGSDNNDEDIGVRRQGFVALVPQSTESIEEFQIMTAGFPAEFGRNSAAIVNAVSKSGESAVHGSIYGFLDNHRLNARNPFATPFTDLNSARYSGDDSTEDQYGGIIGGPVVPRRLFYFASFERQQAHAAQIRHFAVPTEGERGLRVKPETWKSGDFVPIAELQDFFEEQFINYSSAAGEGIFSLYPLPNNPAGPFREHNYSQVGRSEGASRVFSTRLDWYPSFHSIEARYNSTGDESRIPFTGEAINSAIGTRTRTRNVSLVMNSATAAWANALRVSYGRTRLNFPTDKGSPLLFGSSATGAREDLIREIDTPYGHFGPFGATGPVGQLAILPYSPIGVDVYNFPQGRVDNTYQVSDFVTRIFDDHIVKAGFDIRHSQLNSFADRNSRPLMLFGYGEVEAGCFRALFCPFPSEGGLHGTDLAALGAPSAVLQALSTVPLADTTIGLRTTQYDFFVKDDWEVRRNLTLNFGLRYELQSVHHEANNRIERTLAVSPEQFELLPPSGSDDDKRIINAANLAFDGAVRGLQQFLGGRRRIYDPDRNNFAPKAGFAWDPVGRGKTAIHAGYSLQFDANPGAFTSQARNVFPSFVPMNFDVNFQRPTGVWVNNPAFFHFIPTKEPVIKPGTLNTYNLTGNAFATGLGTLFNQQPANPLGNASSNSLSFTLPSKDLKTGSARHIVVSAEQQLGDNWVASIAYAGTRGRHLPRFTTPNGGLISKPILVYTSDDPLNIVDRPPYEGRPLPALGAFTVMENSAVSNYHSMQVSAMKRLSHGLQFRTNWTWSHAIDEVSDMFDSRSFFALPEDSVNPGKDRASANFDVRHRVTGFLTWNGFRDWNFALTGEFQTGQPYTINSAIDDNGDGNLTDRFGLGRNTGRASGIQTVDAAVGRSFSLGGNSRLVARIEAFNLLNRTNLGIPVRIRESPVFGIPFDTALDSRSIRIAAKVLF